MLKVFYIIDTLQPGGAERSLLEILRHLRGIEAQVCQIYLGDGLKSAFEKNGITVHSLQLRSKYGYVTAIRKVLRILRRETPDLIHTVLARADIIGRAAGRFAGRFAGIPVISSFVNESYSPVRFRNMRTTLRFKLRLVQLLDRATASWVFHFVSNSEASKQSNCKALHLANDKVSVIYRGRDPGEFSNPDERRISNLRKELALPDDVPMILNIGRLFPQKGQHDLLQAFRIVRNQCQVRLMIAGDGPLRDSLASSINKLDLAGSVSLLGHRSDVNDLLHLANVFAFPSHFEGHPGALVEAMFAAVPIVASDIPVHRETISDGVSGLLVPLHESEKMAEAILWILENDEDARKMAENAQRTACERFRIENISAQYEDLYQEVFQKWKERHENPSSLAKAPAERR